MLGDAQPALCAAFCRWLLDKYRAPVDGAFVAPCLWYCPDSAILLGIIELAPVVMSWYHRIRSSCFQLYGLCSIEDPACRPSEEALHLGPVTRLQAMPAPCGFCQVAQGYPQQRISLCLAAVCVTEVSILFGRKVLGVLPQIKCGPSCDGWVETAENW